MKTESAYAKSMKSIIEFGHEKIGKKKVVELLTIGESHLWYYIRFMIFHKVRGQQKIQIKNTQPRTVSFANIRFIIQFLKRALAGAFSNFPKNKNWLVVNPNAVSQLLSIDGESTIIGDGYMEYLTQKVLKDDRFILISEFYPPKLSTNIQFKTRTFKPKKKVVNLEWYLFTAMLKPNNWLKTYSYLKEFNKAVSTIESQSKNPIAKQIRPFKRLLIFCLFRELAFKKIIKNKHPKSICGTNEHDVKLKSLIEPAKRIGIDTIGIQHGIIHKNHISYLLAEEDIEYTPFPKKTLTWGNDGKNILNTISSYPKEAVISVGQIRTDVIPNLKIKNKPIATVLFIDQTYKPFELALRNKISTAILDYSKNHPLEKVLIKPHPKDIVNATNYWKSLEDKTEKYNYQIVVDDLYKNISHSKIIVTYCSTAGGEAIYFNKPLILMDFTKNDLGGAIAKGIGKAVYNYNELEEAIEHCDEWFDSLQSNRDKFVRESVFKIDGNVCNRIIDVIIS